MTLPSVPITPLGPVSAATVTFRSLGRLHLTVVLKATFALTPEARMTPLVPDPIHPDEIPDPSGRGLRSAGDLAPYLGETDVLLTGHAEVLPTFSATELRVWLAVVRDGVTCIDRWLELDASARVGRARGHVHINGAGPLSRAWPRRSGLLGGRDPRRLHGAHLEIPEGLDWTYFQAAPAEQRMELLQGDEWLVLGGIFAKRPKLRTQLPVARGVARLYRLRDPRPRKGTAIPLVADTLWIDVDRQCVSLLWRGHVPVEEAELASLHVLAGMELPGREIPWADPFPEEAKKDPVETFVAPLSLSQKPAEVPALPFLPASEPGAEAEGILGETLMISEEVARKLSLGVATPFEEPPQAPAEAENALAGTQTLSAAIAPSRAAAPVLPFKSHWSTPLPRSKSSAAIEIKTEIKIETEIKTETENKVEEDRATPAPRAPSSAASDGENILEGTFQVPDDVARKLAGLPATPFERVDRSVEVPVEAPWVEAIEAVEAVEAVEASDDWLSEDPSEEVLTPIAAVKVASPVEVAKPALLSAPEEEPSEAPQGLGAEFLAAMSAEGES